MSIPSRDVGAVWRREGWLLFACLLTGCVLGLLTGALLVGLLLAVSLYLALQLLLAYQLHRWLVDKRAEPSSGFGVWREIYAELYRLKQHNRQRKHRLNRIVKEFQASTAALPDGAVVLDQHGQIVWFNQAAAALLALRKTDDTGQRLVNLLRQPEIAKFIHRHADGFGELELPSPNHADTTLLLRLIPYGNQQRLLIVRDISAQKRVDAMRRDFVANASHELRTPLTVLRGYLEMMQEDSAANRELGAWRDPIAEMGRQAQRMDHMIDSLLKLARLEADSGQHKHTRVDMPALIRDQITSIRDAQDGRHEYSLSVDDALDLFGRHDQLQSIVSNLVANAARYTPAGGHIRIKWYQDDHGAYFMVTDTGVGIEAAAIPRLTERFYRVDTGRSAATGGTGLGLAIVRHSLDLHEAELHITSEPGQGSTFACHFPKQRLRSAADC